MMVLLGEDITKSNRITTVIPAQNNPFVTEELVSVSNDVSPNGRLPQKTLEEIRKVRSDLEKAAQEVSRLQGTFEVAFVSLIDATASSRITNSLSMPKSTLTIWKV